MSTKTPHPCGDPNQGQQVEHITEKRKKKSKISSLLEIQTKSDCQRQMHRLAQEYYSVRDTYIFFFPLTLITLIGGALSFMGSSSMFSEQAKAISSLTVGILSLVSVAMQNCSKNAKYESRTDSHRTVAVEMKKLVDDIRFTIIAPSSGMSSGDQHDTSNNDNVEDENNRSSHEHPNGNNGGDSEDSNSKESVAEVIQGIKMVYEQVVRSCEFAIPVSIAQSFALVDTRLSLSLCNNVTKERLFKGDDDEVRNYILAATYNELYYEFTNTTGWPWVSPNPHYAVNKAIEKVHCTFIKSSQFLTENYDVDTDVCTLCSWACCFCMNADSWCWAPCKRMRQRHLYHVIGDEEMGKKQQEEGR